MSQTHTRIHTHKHAHNNACVIIGKLNKGEQQVATISYCQTAFDWTFTHTDRTQKDLCRFDE